MIDLKIEGDEKYSMVKDGRLTEKGRAGSHQLGSYLKCRYGQILNKTNVIYSSNTNRTVETAEIIRRELNMENSVPIQVLPNDKDNLILRMTSCQVYDAATKTDKNTTLVPPTQLKAHIYNNTGRNVSSYDQVYDIYDTVAIENCQFGVPLPQWFNAEELFPYYTYMFVEVLKENRYSKFFNGPLLNNIINGLREKSTTIYSGHDYTISPMLKLFGVYDESSPPPYNAILALELHEMKSSDDEEVRVLYQGVKSDRLTELYLPECPPPCLLSKFISVFSPFALDDNSWRKECSSM